jgi:hypothetical protein
MSEVRREEKSLQSRVASRVPRQGHVLDGLCLR